MRILLIIAFLSLVLTSCYMSFSIDEVAEDSTIMRDIAEKEIFNELGVNSSVGYILNNGKLVHASATFNIQDVRGMNVETLELAAEKGIQNGFAQDAKMLLIQITKGIELTTKE